MVVPGVRIVGKGPERKIFTLVHYHNLPFIMLVVVFEIGISSLIAPYHKFPAFRSEHLPSFRPAKSGERRERRSWEISRIWENFGEISLHIQKIMIFSGVT